jgi:hypothetical protein
MDSVVKTNMEGRREAQIPSFGVSFLGGLPWLFFCLKRFVLASCKRASGSHNLIFIKSLTAGFCWEPHTQLRKASASASQKNKRERKRNEVMCFDSERYKSFRRATSKEFQRKIKWNLHIPCHVSALACRALSHTLWTRTNTTLTVYRSRRPWDSPIRIRTQKVKMTSNFVAAHPVASLILEFYDDLHVRENLCLSSKRFLQIERHFQVKVYPPPPKATSCSSATHP